MGELGNGGSSVCLKYGILQKPGEVNGSAVKFAFYLKDKCFHQT